MAWCVSVVSILSMELTIRKHWSGWALALANQLLWSIYICTSRQWGLAPLNLAMWVQCTRGLILWRRKRECTVNVTCQSDEVSR